MRCVEEKRKLSLTTLNSKASKDKEAEGKLRVLIVLERHLRQPANIFLVINRRPGAREEYLHGHISYGTFDIDQLDVR